MSELNVLNSAIYKGVVRHRRFAPKLHRFSYPLYMLFLDLDDINSGKVFTGVLGTSWYKPIRFVEKDYLKGEPGDLESRIRSKVNKLGGDFKQGRIGMLVQARCLGLYFSPANFYFCYQHIDGQEVCRYMLAEVSNTPWNQRHYYLVDLQKQSPTDKAFHVSPFMDLDMAYHWKIKPPELSHKRLLIHIENHAYEQNEVIFDASLALQKVNVTKQNLWKTWCTLPVMTWNIVTGIYHQALKLFCKKIPFIPYQHFEDKKFNH